MAFPFDGLYLLSMHKSSILLTTSLAEPVGKLAIPSSAPTSTLGYGSQKSFKLWHNRKNMIVHDATFSDGLKWRPDDCREAS